jgi:nucleoside-diphosphate-sugar epimerase
MNILITGVNGLLGYEVANLFLKNTNYQVYGISRSDSQFNASNYYHINTNIENDTFLNHLPAVCDIIIHFAQSEHFREFPDKAKKIFDVNIKATQLLLDYALHSSCKQFVYASSGGIYGFGQEIFSEEHDIVLNKTLGYYLTSKLIGELLIKNYQSFFVTQIIRPFFVFGARQRKTMLIPRLIENIRKKVPIQINERGGIKLNPIHVSDAANAVFDIIKSKEHGVFNICGEEILTIKEICNKIGKILNNYPVFETNQDASNDLIGDNSKLKELGFKYQFSFEDGLKKTIINQSR